MGPTTVAADKVEGDGTDSGIKQSAIFNLVIFFFAFGTLKLKDSSSEVLPLESFEWHPLRQVSDWAETNLKKRNPIRRAKKARQRIRSIHTTETN